MGSMRSLGNRGCATVEPIRFTCQDDLAAHWIDTARRDGLRVVGTGIGYNAILTIAGRSCRIEAIDLTDGRYSLDLELIENDRARSRIEHILCASGAMCSVPQIFGATDALYRCRSGTCERWISRLQGTATGVKVTQRRRNDAHEEFLEGLIKNPESNSVEFSTGPAYDVARQCPSEFIRLTIESGLLIGEAHRKFVKDLAHDLEQLGSVPAVLLGIVVER